MQLNFLRSEKLLHTAKIVLISYDELISQTFSKPLLENDFQKITTVAISNENYTGSLLLLERLMINHTDIFRYFQILQAQILDEPIKCLILSNFLILRIHFSHFTDSNSEISLNVTSLKSNCNKILELVEEKIQKESTDWDNVFDMYILIELCYISIYFMFKLFFSRENVATYSNAYDEAQVSTDVFNMLLIKKSLRSWLTPVMELIQLLNEKVKFKEYLSNILTMDKKCFDMTSNKFIIYNFECLLDPIFLCLKYSISGRFNELAGELEIDHDGFSESILHLFSIVMEYLMINFKNYEKIFISKVSSFAYYENFLMLSSLINLNLCKVKFLARDNQFDFHTFSPFFFDFFHVFFSKFQQATTSKVKDLFFILGGVNQYQYQSLLDMFKFENFLINPCLGFSIDKMMDMIIYHSLASYTGDNNYEAISRNLWLKPLIECYCVCLVYKNLLMIIMDIVLVKDETSERHLRTSDVNETFSRILKIFEKVIVEKNKIILPRKTLLFKETFIISFLIIFDCFLNEFKTIAGIFFKENKDREEILVDAISEMIKCQNKITFLLGNKILKKIRCDDHLNRIRLYGYHSFPLDFYDIIQKPNLLTKSKDLTLTDDVEMDFRNDENSTNNITPNMTTSQANANDNNFTTRKRNSDVKNNNPVSSSANVKLEEDFSLFKNPFVTAKSAMPKSKLPPTLQYDISDFIMHFDIQQLNELDLKDVKFHHNKKHQSILKTKLQSSFLLIQNDNGIELIEEDSKCLGRCENSSSINENITKPDMDYLVLVNMSTGSSVNAAENRIYEGNSLQNYRNQFKYYDIAEELDKYSFLENMREFLILN